MNPRSAFFFFSFFFSFEFIRFCESNARLTTKFNDFSTSIASNAIMQIRIIVICSKFLIEAPSGIVFFIVCTRLNTCPARPRVTVNFLRFPFSKSCSTEVYDRCVMFADKSSRPASADPLCPSSSSPLHLHAIPSFPLSPFLFLPLPSHLPVSPLNNKYERVLREYPEGAISGVQASDPTLSHPSKPSSGLHPPPHTFFHDPKRESNTLRGETRLASMGVTARVSPIALWRPLLFSSRFVFPVDERAPNRRMS